MYEKTMDLRELNVLRFKPKSKRIEIVEKIGEISIVYARPSGIGGLLQVQRTRYGLNQ